MRKQVIHGILLSGFLCASGLAHNAVGRNTAEPRAQVRANRCAGARSVLLDIVAWDREEQHHEVPIWQLPCGSFGEHLRATTFVPKCLIKESGLIPRVRLSLTLVLKNLVITKEACSRISSERLEGEDLLFPDMRKELSEQIQVMKAFPDSLTGGRLHSQRRRLAGNRSAPPFSQKLINRLPTGWIWHEQKYFLHLADRTLGGSQPIASEPDARNLTHFLRA